MNDATPASPSGGDGNGREPFHWRSAISWKTRERIVCRGYDINELAEKASLTDMVFLIFQGRLPSPDEEQMLTHLMIVFVEHSFSPSTVAARMAAVGRPPLNAAIAAGILTFGDAHGPGLAYSEMMVDWLARARATETPLDQIAEQLVEDCEARGRKVLGLHQPQHIMDPRADGVFAKARKLGLARDYVALQTAIQRAFNRRRETQLHPNLLGAAGSVLLDLGFQPNACWAIGILARAFGCAAHAIEELEREPAWRASGRSSMVDLLDLSLQGAEYYDGPAERPVPTLDERKRAAASARERKESD
jgi:citrate synthase